MLGGALEKAISEAEQKVGIRIGEAQIVADGRRGGRQKGHVAVHVKIEQLIEPLEAQVAAELEAVVADYFAEIVAELEGIADLRQLAVEIVADSETAADVDEGNAFFRGAEAGMQAIVGIGA